MRAPTGQRRASRGLRWGPRAARGPAAPACDAAVPCCAAGRTTPAQRHRLVQGLVCELCPPQQGRRSRWPSGQRRPKLSWLRGGHLLAPLAAGGMRRAPRPARSAPACGRWEAVAHCLITMHAGMCLPLAVQAVQGWAWHGGRRRLGTLQHQRRLPLTRPRWRSAPRRRAAAARPPAPQRAPPAGVTAAVAAQCQQAAAHAGIWRQCTVSLQECQSSTGCMTPKTTSGAVCRADGS